LSNRHELSYVTPFEPQTGMYSLVHAVEQSDEDLDDKDEDPGALPSPTSASPATLPDELEDAHSPVLTCVMLGSVHWANLSSQLFPYVTPSEPHTGSYTSKHANSCAHEEPTSSPPDEAEASALPALPLALVLEHSPVETIESESSPNWHLVTSNSHSLPYVWPSDPHTGE